MQKNLKLNFKYIANQIKNNLKKGREIKLI